MSGLQDCQLECWCAFDAHIDRHSLAHHRRQRQRDEMLFLIGFHVKSFDDLTIVCSQRLVRTIYVQRVDTRKSKEFRMMENRWSLEFNDFSSAIARNACSRYTVCIGIRNTRPWSYMHKTLTQTHMRWIIFPSLRAHLLPENCTLLRNMHSRRTCAGPKTIRLSSIHDTRAHLHPHHIQSETWNTTKKRHTRTK